MQRNVTRRLWLSLALVGGRAGLAAEATASRPLRVAFVQGNLAQFTLDEATGQYRGVSADIARELARRWRQPVEVALLTPAAIVEAVAQHRIDIGFVAPTPGRIGKVLYSQTYVLVQQSAFVASDGPIASVSELDRPGQRVGANAGDSVAGYLARTLRSATLAESSDMTMRSPAVGAGRHGFGFRRQSPAPRRRHPGRTGPPPASGQHLRRAAGHRRRA